VRENLAPDGSETAHQAEGAPGAERRRVAVGYVAQINGDAARSCLWPRV